MTTAEMDPFLNIAEADVRVGPQNGFYPMPDGKLWVTRTVQSYDAMSLAEIVRRNLDRVPDVEIDFLRGACAVAGSAVYYNGARVVTAIQTEQYTDDSDDGRQSRPRIVTMPDWDFLAKELEYKEIKNPVVLLRDDLSDHRRALQLVRGIVIKKMEVDPANIYVAVLYDKEAELEPDSLESCLEDVVRVDFSVRPAPGVWLDHQSQADREKLIQRQQDIAPYIAEMRQAAAFFETILVPDPELMERVIAQSAIQLYS